MKTIDQAVNYPFPGVCRISYGPNDVSTLLDFASVSPNKDALAVLGEGSMPVQPDDVQAYRSNGKTVLVFPLEPDEKLYGFGLQYRSIEHRGQLFELRVDHYKGRDDGRTHAPVPFCISSRGYGIFVNTASRMLVYAGRSHRKDRHPEIRSRRDPDWRAVAVSEMMEMAIADESVEVVLFSGPDLLDVVRRFNLYCGGGCLPPKWGLGFWHRTPLQYTADDVKREISEFDENAMPLDVIGLEPGWHSSSYPTTCEWHPEAFPDPGAFLSRCSSAGVRINLWENCYIHPGCELGEALEPLSGSHTGAWGGLCPDLSMAEARDIIASHHMENHVKLGVSGYKLDECDDDAWIFPDFSEFPSGIAAEKLHQVYGTLFQKTTYSMYRAEDTRTYGQVRAGNAGTVSFPYVIYNDCYDHREYITGLCSGSLSGVLFTPEARSAATSEEWLRRFQATCFSPLAQLNAWASGTKPWDFEDVADEVRETILLRMKLIPYLYSAFARYHADGTPPFRAMILENGGAAFSEAYIQGELDGTSNPYSLPETSDVSDQFMMGPHLLVAPLFAGEESRTVKIPPGKWYDFYTGDLTGQECTIEIAASQLEIPLFVRDGGIIPLFTGDHTRVPSSGSETPIEVRHYGTLPGDYELYDDDGVTFAYERGECRRWRLKTRADQTTGRLEGEVIDLGGGFASGYRIASWRFMSRDEE